MGDSGDKETNWGPAEGASAGPTGPSAAESRQITRQGARWEQEAKNPGGRSSVREWLMGLITVAGMVGLNAKWPEIMEAVGRKAPLAVEIINGMDKVADKLFPPAMVETSKVIGELGAAAAGSVPEVGRQLVPLFVQIPEVGKEVAAWTQHITGPQVLEAAAIGGLAVLGGKAIGALRERRERLMKEDRHAVRTALWGGN